MLLFYIYTATADLVKEQMDKGLLDLGLLLEPVDMEKYGNKAMLNLLFGKVDKPVMDACITYLKISA